MRHTGLRPLLFLLIGGCILCVPPAIAQDWPQWRGPARDGAAAGFAEPQAWPEGLSRQWSTSVGEGHSSPVTAGDKVFVHTRQGDSEVVSCLDLPTGTVRWRDSYAAPYIMNPATSAHGKGPKSTPVVSRGRLCTLGIAGILSCYDAESGRLFWRKDFKEQFPKTFPEFGTSMSPVVEGNLLIVHVGSDGGGALMAFELDGGTLRWTWAEGDGPGYASPIIIDLPGGRQLVTQSRTHIIGVAAGDGRPLWSLPYTNRYVVNLITPVRYRDLLIFSGVDSGILAYRIEKKGDVWTPEKVWENREASFYMSSPILDGAFLLGMSYRNKGQFVCLDAETGKMLWAGEGRQGENAALVKAGSNILLLTNDAELRVARMGGGKLEVLWRYKVADSPTWAHPVVTSRGVLVKDAETLSLWAFHPP